jgi:hypothetical protein
LSETVTVAIDGTLFLHGKSYRAPEQ